MKVYRSILACVLALVTTFVVGCSSPKAAIPTTYTEIQIQQTIVVIGHSFVILKSGK